MVHLNLLPTQDPIEELLEVQDDPHDNTTEVLVLDNEPYNMYQVNNPQLTDSEELSDIDTNLIAYDIDQKETPYSSNRTTFVCTHSKESNLCLAQPTDKVKKTWYNQMSKSELRVDPKFATDRECYEMEATLLNIDPNVIQATYLGPLIDLPPIPTFSLNPGSKLQAHLPSGLPITTLIDT